MLSKAEVVEAESWLRTQQFERTRQLEGAGFGDRLEEWSDGSFLVRLVRDRSQWFVEVSRSGWTDCFELDLIAWAIDTKETSITGRLSAISSRELDHLLLTSMKPASSEPTITCYPRDTDS